MTAPLPVLVVESSPWLAAQVESLLLDDAPVPTEEVVAVADVQELREHVEDRGLVVVGPSHLDTNALGKLARLHDERPALRIVVTTDGEHPLVPAAVAAVGPDALAGAHNPAELRSALERALRRGSGLEALITGDGAAESVRDGQVYTVCSPTGGCGKTFFATNLAHLLTTTLSGSVVLVDLDLQFGEVDTALRLRPSYTIADLVEIYDDEQLVAALPEITVTHESGLRVLASPGDPAEAEKIKPQDVARIVELLGKEFDYVVLDTPTGLSDPVLATLDRCDHFFIVAALDISSVRNLRLFTQTLSRLAVPEEDISLLLNKDQTGTGIEADEVEAFFPEGFTARLPFSREVSRSMNAGQPIVAANPPAEVSRGLARTAMQFMPPNSAGWVQEQLDDYESRSLSGWFRVRMRNSGFDRSLGDGKAAGKEADR